LDGRTTFTSKLNADGHGDVFELCSGASHTTKFRIGEVMT